MSITTKELMLLKDGITMTQNKIKFLEGCSGYCVDAQMKSLCQQMAIDCQDNINVLRKYISSSANS